MKIIGMVHPHNDNDKRCTEHIDFSSSGPAIYEGEDFNCTYCGDKWKTPVVEFPLVVCYYSADCDGQHLTCGRYEGMSDMAVYYDDYDAGCTSDDPFCECLFCIPGM